VKQKNSVMTMPAMAAADAAVVWITVHAICEASILCLRRHCDHSSSHGLRK
jgi:hypothetical protein